MEDNTLLISVIMIVGLIIVGAGYWVYMSDKKNQSTHLLERFLCIFSHSFHEARWVYIELHQEVQRSNQEIVNKITERIWEDMKNECTLFFNGCSIFPTDYHKSDVDEDTVINFIERMLPTIQGLHQQYRKKRISIEELQTQFFTKIKEFLLSEIEKDRRLHIQNQ